MSLEAPPRARLLVVEDSEVQALELSAALESAGFEVTRAASAEEALERLNSDVPDLIVADLNLPKMDGREMTRQLRLNARTRTVPVLMVTSANGPADEIAGLESGADAYVSKSRDFQALIMRANALLRGGRSERSFDGLDFRRAQVLLADSSPTRRLQIEALLSKDNVVIRGVGGLPVNPEASDDCVLVNLVDPGFDGVAVCAELAQRRDAFAPMHGFTAFLIVGLGGEQRAVEDVSKAAFAAGADDVLPSLSDPELLRLRLRALLRRKLVQEEARRLDEERHTAQVASEHFRILVQGVVDYAIYMLDREGRVATWNAGAERIKGYTAEEIIGEHISRFYTEEDRVAGDPERALFTARTEGRYEIERQRVRKDGSVFWAHVVIDPILDGEGVLQGYAKITRDITERRLAAEELQQTRSALMQAQKMEAIGQLTGGIAHDFNNMLAGIMAGLGLLQRRIEAKRYDETGPLIEAALTSANRAASLTSRLLAFGRRQSLDIKPVDVNGAISSMKLLLDRTMGENIRTEMRLSPDSLWALSDVSQLESAILNLAINARDAMSGGGTLTIGTRATHVDDPSIYGEDMASGDYVVVSVGDTGTGMSEEVLAKVFEPFFTTKPIGQGTGLGLSMVYGFVRQSGGRVDIQSAMGAGTTVSLWLPRSAAGAEPREKRKPAQPKGQGQPILLVEDDAQVRMLVVALLKELGYAPIEAKDAAEALSVVESDKEIALVISDVGLPGLDGRRLAEICRRKRPDVKLLFITGYAEHAAVRSQFLSEGMDMIMKPFSLDVIAEKVRDMVAN